MLAQTDIVQRIIQIKPGTGADHHDTRHQAFGHNDPAQCRTAVIENANDISARQAT